MSQTKNSKYSSDNFFFPKMVSVILGSSYHTDVCSSVKFSDKFEASFSSRAGNPSVLHPEFGIWSAFIWTMASCNM